MKFFKKGLKFGLFLLVLFSSYFPAKQFLNELNNNKILNQEVYAQSPFDLPDSLCVPFGDCSCPKPSSTPEVTPSPPLGASPTPSLTPTQTPTPTIQPTPTPGGSGGDGGGVGGPPSAPVCQDAKPAQVILRNLTNLGNGKVELIWDPVDPATHYNISYGLSSGNYSYGVDNTGKTTSFQIGGLGMTNYCFVIRAVNNCQPGDPSNEKCLFSQGKVLGVSTLGATGSKDSLFYSLFIISSLCFSISLKLLIPAKKLA